MHLLCPHCHNPIELGELTLSQEVVCPACGSGIRLTGGSTQGAPPRTLGRFELQSTLGSGAFGVVYKARDPAMDRVVAVKVPRSGDLSKADELERFLREARSAAQLRHPGVVTIHEVGQADGVPFLVSEFVEGVTLSDVLSARRPTVREAARLVAEGAEALHYAHQQGVVHRDVKPSNLMITTDGDGETHVKVMDFGLAKREAGEVTLTMEGNILGTPAYMPPEQARGEGHRVDARGDVYSLGVVLYQLLSGELPFRGTTRMLLHQVLNDEPRSPRSLNDRIPRDLETVCLKAMSKEPARRYHTAKELADDLRRWLSGDAIVARPVGRVEKLWRWARRNRAVASLLALVMLSLAAGTLVATYYERIANERAAEAEAHARTAGEQKERADREADEARAQERLARRNLYAANSNLADAAWHNGNTGRTMRLLDTITTGQGKEDIRDFEWHHLYHLCHDDLQTLTGHKRNLSCLAFGPDGRVLASASYDGTVRLWDSVEGRPVRALADTGGLVGKLAFASDGVLVTAGEGGVRFWDPATGRQTGACRGTFAPVASLAIMPDGKRLLTGGADGVVKLWDLKSGEEVRSFPGHSAAVSALAVLTGGERFVSYAADGTVRTRGLDGADTTRPLQGHPAGGQDAAFSRDGRSLALTYGNWNMLSWDVESGRQVVSLHQGTEYFNSVVISPDGRWLATTSYDRTVRLWDARTGRLHRVLRGHVWGVFRLAFSPDGRRVACGDIDGDIKVFDLTTGTDLRLLRGHGGGVVTVAYDPVRPRVASAGDDGLVRLWDSRSGQPLMSLEGHKGQVIRVVYGPDGKLMASAGQDQTVRLWNADTGRYLRTLQGHKGPVHRLAFRPDGRQLASGGADQTVKVWDTESGKELRELKGQAVPIDAVAYSPDGRWLAFGGGYEGQHGLYEVRLWDAKEWREARILVGEDKHDRGITDLAFLPDRKHLVSSGADDILILWDLETGRLVRTMHAHDRQVYSVAASPNGRRLASASNDATLKVWDPGDGHDLITLRGHTNRVCAVAFSPDGGQLASASLDGTVRLWDGRPRTPEVRAEREALGLLDFLFDLPLVKEDVIERIRADRTINEDTRRIALELAGGYRERLPRIQAEATPVVLRPESPAADMRRATKLLERACEIDPTIGEFWLLLGHGRYRIGDAAGAVAAFTRSGVDKPHPTTLAVLAMAQHRAGQTEQAKATLARVREAAKSPQVASDALAQRFRKEAEALLEGKKP